MQEVPAEPISERGHATAEPESPTEPATPRPNANAQSRIFISYKRGVEPDEPIAGEVYQALSTDHDVFIDQTMPVGTPWA